MKDENKTKEELITELRKLRDSENRYRTLFDNLPVDVGHSSPYGHILHRNESLRDMSSYSDEKFKQNSYQKEEKVAGLLDCLKNDGLVGDFETVLKRRDGTTFLANLSIAMVSLGNQDVFLTVVEDITEHRQAEKRIQAILEEKELLLKEIYHRVKNNMQVISNLLRLQSKRINDEKYREMFRESQNRIQSMSLIHEELYQSGSLATVDFNGFVRSLSNNLLRSYRMDMGQIVLRINVDEEVLLPVDTAIPCGLIVNELVSNSLKYAFPEKWQSPGNRSAGIRNTRNAQRNTEERQEGINEIKISLRLVGEGEIELVVSDNGIGIPDGLDLRNISSLGLQLVNTLVAQLHGEIKLDRTEGTEFCIKLRKEPKDGQNANFSC